MSTRALPPENLARMTPDNPTGEPWPRIYRAVTAVQLQEWVSTSPNAQPGQVARSFTYTLECGHIYPGCAALYRPGLPEGHLRTRADLRPCKQRMRCGGCEEAEFREAVRAAVVGTLWEGVVPR